MEINSKFIMKKDIYRFLIVLIAILLASIFVQNFLSFSNIINLIRQIFLLTLISYGISLSMLVGGLDLSVGSVAALSTCLAAALISRGHIFLGCVSGLLIGSFIGFINGFLIGRFKLPDFVMTFSMMYIARGLALTYTQGQSIYGFTRSFTWIGKSFLGPIPMPAIISIFIMIFLYLLLNKTVFGKITYAVGSNKKAAQFSGISVSRNLISIYTLSGLLAGLAGLIYIARLGAADADLGISWPLDGIAVCVIGGITFVGGEGNILGLLIGGIFLAVIKNCINLLGIAPRLQEFFVGFLVILTVTIDYYARKKEL